MTRIDKTPTEASRNSEQSTTDQILDLLLEALIERQQERRKQAPAPPQPAPTATSPKEPQSRSEAVVPQPRPEPPPAEAKRASKASAHPPVPSPPPSEPQPGEEGWQPPPRLPTINMGKMIGRLALFLALVLVAVNIPVTRYGVSLARILPERTSLIIRDGLILKGSGPEIYKLEDNQLRWISSMDAFEHLGLTWGDVHVVEDTFLDKFEKGRAIHVLLKCRQSPHIYRLENEAKRWIRDMETFESEGHEWDDVRFVSCEYLRNLPDGPTIPEDAGSPPQP